MGCGVSPELEKLSSEFSALKDKANAAIADVEMGITAGLDKITGDIAGKLSDLKAAADGIIPDVAVKLPNLGSELGKLQGALASGSPLGVAALTGPGSILSKFSSLSLPGIDVGSLMSGAGGLDLCSQAPNVDLIIGVDEDGNETLETVKKGLTSDAPFVDAAAPEPKTAVKDAGSFLPNLVSKDVPTAMDTESNASSTVQPIEGPPSPPSDSLAVTSPFFKSRYTWYAVTSPSVGGGKKMYWTLKAFNGKLSEAYWSFKTMVEQSINNLSYSIDSEQSDEPYRIILDEDESKYEYHYGSIVYDVRRADLMSMKMPHPEQASKRAMSAFVKDPFALLTNPASISKFQPTEKEVAGIFAASDFPKPSRNTNWNAVFNDSGQFVGLDHDPKKADSPKYSNGQRKNVDGNSIYATWAAIYPDAAGFFSLKEFVDSQVGKKKFKTSGDLQAVVAHTISKGSKQSGNFALEEESTE